MWLSKKNDKAGSGKFGTFQTSSVSEISSDDEDEIPSLSRVLGNNACQLEDHLNDIERAIVKEPKVREDQIVVEDSPTEKQLVVDEDQPNVVE